MTSYESEGTTSEAIVHIGIVVMFTSNGTATQIGCAFDVTVLYTKVVNLSTAQTREESALAVCYDLNIADNMVVTIECAAERSCLVSIVVETDGCEPVAALHIDVAGK